MTNKKLTLLSLVFLTLGAMAYATLRVWRAGSATAGTVSNVRMLIESGGTIGEKPATEAFSAGYLEAIFGDNPELLAELKNVVSKGISDEPSLNLGEVSAMIVTYHKNGDDKIRDVVAHVIGGFPLAKLKPGFHRDGFMKYMLDENLWTVGDSALNMLGRDMVLFANEDVAEKQNAVVEGLLSGDVLPLVDRIQTPLYYTIVMPDPKRVVPRQLKNHVQALIFKGRLSQTSGTFETLVLTPSSRSASYALSIVSDLKAMAEMALKAKFKGVVQQKNWGPHIDPWWAYEMVNTSEKISIEKEENILRIHSDFDRVMVNVVMKVLERMGRDLTQTRMTLEQGLDPRIVDRKMATRKPGHYWTEAHRWGPNWPIPPTDEEIAERKKAIEASTPVPTRAENAEQAS